MSTTIARPKPYTKKVLVDGQWETHQRTKDGKLGWRLRKRDPRVQGGQTHELFWGTEQEAEDRMAVLAHTLNTSAPAPSRRNGSMTLGAAAEAFLEDYAWKVKPYGNAPGVPRPFSTWAKARNMLAIYLLPAVGEDVRMRTITGKRLEEAIGALTLADDKTPVAPNTKSTVVGVTKKFFRWCVPDIIATSPAERLPTVWGASTSRQVVVVPSILDVEKLAAAMDAEWPGRGDIVRLIAYTGMRWEEAAALHWWSVKMRLKYIIVEETATESGGRRQHRTGEDAGKSRASRRHLTIIEQAEAPLHRLNERRKAGAAAEAEKEARRQLRAERNRKAGRGVREPNMPLEDRWTLLVSGAQGGWLSYATWRRHLKKAQEASGVHYTAHDLRHVCASILIAAGVDDEKVREQMGHANTDITHRVYRHVYAIDRTELARRISQKVAVLTKAEMSAAQAEADAQRDDDFPEHEEW